VNETEGKISLLRDELMASENKLEAMEQDYEELVRHRSEAQKLAMTHLKQHNEHVRTKMAVLSKKNEAFRDEIYRLRRMYVE